MSYIKYALFFSILSTAGMSAPDYSRVDDLPATSCNILKQNAKQIVQEHCKEEAEHYKYCLETDPSLLVAYETQEAEISIHICLMNNSDLIETLNRNNCDWSEADFI
jgi:hypothetical protein